jgi:hypothetical protein
MFQYPRIRLSMYRSFQVIYEITIVPCVSSRWSVTYLKVCRVFGYITVCTAEMPIESAIPSVEFDMTHDPLAVDRPIPLYGMLNCFVCMVYC